MILDLTLVDQIIIRKYQLNFGLIQLGMRVIFEIDLSLLFIIEYLLFCGITLVLRTIKYTCLDVWDIITTQANIYNFLTNVLRNMFTLGVHMINPSTSYSIWTNEKPIHLGTYILRRIYSPWKRIWQSYMTLKKPWILMSLS